jgi:RND superfamily putative drug exporter
MIFRSPVTPIVPLATIGISYLISRGMVAWLTYVGLTVVSFTQAFLVVILFGAGTDYCLFIIGRFREHIVEQQEPKEASRQALTRVGETITSSAGTVIVGMVSMMFAQMKLFSSTGPSIAIGVAVTLLAGLTFTPALLAILGRRAFWLARIDKAHEENPFWKRLAHLLSRRLWLPLAGALVVLVPLAIYGVGVHQTFNMTADLSDKVSSKQGFEVLAEHFGAGEMQPVEIVVTDLPEIASPAGLAEIDRMTSEALAIEGVVDVRSLLRPQGSKGSNIRDFFLADNQLRLLAQSLGSFTTASHEDETETGSLFTGMQAFDLDAFSLYFTDLYEAYPNLPQDHVQACTDAMTGLSLALATSGQPVFVPQQLETIAFQIEAAGASISQSSEDAPGQDLTAQFETLQSYFDELGASIPTLAATYEYSRVSEKLDQLAGLAALAGAGNISAGVGISEQQALFVQSNVTDLAASINDLSIVAEAIALHVIFIPSDELMARGELQPSEKLMAALASFQTVATTLADDFAGYEQPWFWPVALAGAGASDLGQLFTQYVNVDGTTTRIQAILADEPYAHGAMATVERLNEIFNPSHGGYASGTTATTVDIQRILKIDTTQTMAIVLVGIAIVLVWLLRSLVAPVYLLLTILLSYLATLGICRAVFEGIFHSELTWWEPFFVFVLLIALGSDYNIFLMGRVKEETIRHGTREGVGEALQHTGGIITSAGIILAGTFAALFTSSILGLIQIGFAVMVGVLLDTFVIRTILVPAIAMLLGRWNWWPGKEPKATPSNSPFGKGGE